jgi:hypothetical protein
MSVVSARRYGAVVAVNVLIGVVGAVLPTLTHAATTSAPRPSGHSVTKMERRIEHTSVELVRNGGFAEGRTHWHVSGHAEPHLRIVDPGLHSSHAARVVASTHGVAALTEQLAMKSTVNGDRYEASAMVRRTGHRRVGVILRVNEVKDGHVVGHARRRVVLRRSTWRRVAVGYTARRNGARLVVRLVSVSARSRARKGFEADDVKVVQTRTVRFVPVSIPTPVPTPPVAPVPSPTVPAPVASPASGCTVSSLLVPSCGAWWGVYKPPSAGENWETTYTDLESQVGRQFNIVYRYQDMSNSVGSGQFPDASERALGVNHILMFSWASRVFSTNTQLLWSNIASGEYDASVIDPEAARLKAYGKPVFLTFDPEMDRRMPAAGTPADYVAAYRHIHDRLAADGVTNVIWVWTVTGTGAHDSEFASLYPGNSYVDWIGYDPYNFASCHSTAWRSFDATVDPFYQWLETNGYGDKPFMLPEYGTVADPSDSSASADWYAGVPAGIAAHPNIKAVVEWDDTAAPCNTELTVDPSTLTGFAAAGNNPTFNQATGTP